jgi:hypothetical protein
MRPITVTAGPLAAADADGIAQAQQPAATFTLNGALVANGVAQLGAPRRVLITTTANETGVTFTVTGTNRAGDVLSEAVTGVNNTSTYTDLDFFTVTSVTNSAALAGNVTIGTNGIGGSPWVRFDEYAPHGVAIQCTVSGTVNYTVQQTLDDPNVSGTTLTPATMTWVSSSDTNVVGATATQQTNYNFTPVFARILLNSGSGTVTGTFLQASAVPK